MACLIVPGARTRLRLVFRQWLLAKDQELHVKLAAPKYVLRGGRLPSYQETISSKVGRMAIRGKRWALICERFIDWLFVQAGDPDGHCRFSIVAEEDL